MKITIINNNNNDNIMHREITSFSACLRHYCNNSAFLKRSRVFSQHIGHFCNIALPQQDLVLRWGIFPSTTSSL